MQVQVTVHPAEFNDGWVTVVYGVAPLARDVVEVKTLNELTASVTKVRGSIKQNAVITVRALDRKLKGFDNWKQTNVFLFEVKV